MERRSLYLGTMLFTFSGRLDLDLSHRIESQMLIEVDQTQCQRVVEILSVVDIPSDREETKLINLTPGETASLYFLTVAICHQTQGLTGVIDGQTLRGWDYLSNKLRLAAEVDKTLLNPDRWASMTADVLRALFADPQMGETLSDVTGRTELIRNLGGTLRTERWDSITRLYEVAGARVNIGSPNLLSLMAHFHAYRDPVFKKTYFFLGLMSNSGLWRYRDPENVGPPVDYHEVRGHLRLGTVSIIEPELRRKVLKGEPVSELEDISIRAAVHDAIKRIAEIHVRVNAMELHYLFWNVFRSVCTRVHPSCHFAKDVTLPARYIPLLKLADNKGACPFVSICPSADVEVRYLEHQFQTDWY
jgi:hypothetical protein